MLRNVLIAHGIPCIIFLLIKLIIFIFKYNKHLSNKWKMLFLSIISSIILQEAIYYLGQVYSFTAVFVIIEILIILFDKFIYSKLLKSVDKKTITKCSIIGNIIPGICLLIYNVIFINVFIYYIN